jgi:hypothetical protein
MDDDKPADVAIRPVLPSRAQTEAPRFDLAAQVERLGPDSLLPPKRNEMSKRRPPVKKRASEALPAREVTRILKNRKKNMKKAKKRVLSDAVRSVRPPAGRRKPGNPKNPNRPLELKNRLDAVLTIFTELPKEEQRPFGEVMKSLDGLSRPGRKRVLDALAKVYG